MRTAKKARKIIGLIKLPRILPGKSLLKLTKPFGEKLPGAFYSQILKKRW